MSSYHVVFTGTVIYETMYYREIDEEEECMVKRNEFKKRSRYLAMLTALSLAFSNIGSCVNMEVRKDRKLAVRKKTAVLGKKT